MKTIEKETGQIFEVYTNKKEFSEMIKTVMLDNAVWGNVWIDEDSSLYIKYNNGEEVSLAIGDPLIKIKYSKIKSGVYNNPSTNALYNLQIKYNDHYEDYDVEKRLQ
jgi:hypothetical protein